MDDRGKSTNTEAFIAFFNFFVKEEDPMRTPMFFLCGMAACLTLMWAAAAAAVPTLTHEYTFDTDLSDSVGGLPANPLWSAVMVDGSAGISGGAVRFQTVGDMLILEDQNVLSPSAWTVSFWEKGELGAGLTYNDGYFFSDAGASTSNVTNLFLRRFRYTVPGDPDPTYRIGANGMAGGSNGQYTKYDPRELPLDVWHHHVVTMEDGGVSKWYINGDLAAQTIVPGLWNGLVNGLDEGNSGYNGLCIGNRAVDGARTFYGYIDEFQIYEGTAHEGMAEYLYDNPGANLSTYDAVNYPDPNPGNGGSRIPDGAKLYRWRFDGDLNEEGGVYNGTAINDATVGTSDGLVGGAVYFDGVDDAVSISKDVVSDGSTTFTFWSKAHADGTTGYLISDSADVENLLYRRFRSSDSTSRFAGWINGRSYAEYPNPDGESWPNETWIHHAIVISEDDQYTAFYINGALQEIRLFDIAALFDWEGLTTDLYLGNRADLNRDYKGWLDDLQIYDFALAGDQIAYLFNNPGETLDLGTAVLEGDLNGDGLVGSADLDIVRGNWGQSVSGPEQGDANGDGVVGSADLDIVRANWGATAAAAVPEPAMLSLLLLVGAVVIGRRGRIGQ